MAVPRLIGGLATAATTVKADDGYGDNGVAYNLRAKSARTAPAGTGGECIFTNLYVTLTRGGACSLNISVLIDDVAKSVTTIALGDVTVAGTDETTLHEIALAEAFLDGGAVEQLRYYPRGTWVQVLAETLYASPADMHKQVVDDVEVEYEVVRETKAPVA